MHVLQNKAKIKYSGKLHIDLKKKYLFFLVLLVVFWLLLPPICGYYYFDPATRLDGSVGTIILDSNAPILCAVGGSSVSGFLKAKREDGVTTVFSGWGVNAKIKIEYYFLWIRWRSLESIPGRDNEWHCEFPCYNPIDFVRSFIVWYICPANS